MAAPHHGNEAGLPSRSRGSTKPGTSSGGEKLFVEATADMASDYRRFADVFSELFGIMRDDWQWQPQDWLDIQGFLWIALDKTATAPLETDASPQHQRKPREAYADFPHEPHPLRTARHR